MEPGGRQADPGSNQTGKHLLTSERSLNRSTMTRSNRNVINPMFRLLLAHCSVAVSLVEISICSGRMRPQEVQVEAPPGVDNSVLFSLDWPQKALFFSIKSSDKKGGQRCCTFPYCSSHPFIWRPAVTRRPSPPRSFEA